MSQADTLLKPLFMLVLLPGMLPPRTGNMSRMMGKADADGLRRTSYQALCDPPGGTSCIAVHQTVSVRYLGARPIAELTPGDMVLTAEGYQPYLGSMHDVNAAATLTLTLAHGRCDAHRPLCSDCHWFRP